MTSASISFITRVIMNYTTRNACVYIKALWIKPEQAVAVLVEGRRKSGYVWLLKLLTIDSYKYKYNKN